MDCVKVSDGPFRGQRRVQCAARMVQRAWRGLEGGTACGVLWCRCVIRQ